MIGKRQEEKDVCRIGSNGYHRRSYETGRVNILSRHQHLVGSL